MHCRRGATVPPCFVVVVSPTIYSGITEYKNISEKCSSILPHHRMIQGSNHRLYIKDGQALLFVNSSFESSTWVVWLNIYACKEFSFRYHHLQVCPSKADFQLPCSCGKYIRGYLRNCNISDDMITIKKNLLEIKTHSTIFLTQSFQGRCCETNQSSLQVIPCWKWDNLQVANSPSPLVPNQLGSGHFPL